MSPNPEIQVSVVIPAYHAWTTLPRVLAALRPQVEHPYREVIIIDSSGGPEAAQLARDYPWARVVVLAERAFPGRARNVGVDAALGQSIAFLDADAVPAPDWLDQLLAAGVDAGHDAVGGAVTNGTPWHPIGTAAYLLEFANWRPGRRGSLAHSPTCNLFVRRSAFDELGGFQEDIFAGEDTIFTFCLARQGRLGFAPRARVAHLNRTRLVEFVRHQQRLGKGFADICARVEDYPKRMFTRPWLIPVTVPLRIGSLGRQLRGAPTEAAQAALLSPLLVLGLVAWALGVARGRCSGPLPGAGAVGPPLVEGARERP